MNEKKRKRKKELEFWEMHKEHVTQSSKSQGIVSV